LEDRWLLSAVGFSAPANVTMAAGTTMYVPLNSTDAGQTVTYSVTASDASKLTPVIMPSTDKTLQLNVLVNGVTETMNFQLFDGLSPNTTAKIEQLVNSGFYNGLQIYRNGKDQSGNLFVIQGGNDPPTGAIKTDQSTMAEEFNPDLQYTGAGILAMARTSAAGSSSTEFFIMEEAARFLDYNYTAFGFQTTGQSVDQAISAMADENSTQDPNGLGYLQTPLTITSASIITDTQNGVLQLRAPAGATGTFTVTVTASDGTNTPTPHTFNVTLQADDSSNAANPWASVIPAAPTGLTYLPPSGASNQFTDLNNSSGKTLQFQVSGVTSGNVVEVLADGNVIGKATATGSTVTVTTNGSTTLSDGSHTFTAIQVAPSQTATVNENDGNSTTAESETADVPSLNSGAVSLNVDTAAPQFNSTPPTAAIVGTPYSYQVTTKADTSGAVTYQLVSPPAGMTINSTTGKITWTPQKSQTPSVAVDVRAADVAGNTADQQFTVNVAANGYAPVLTAHSPSLGTIDDETTKTISLATFINNGSGTTTITDQDTNAVLGGIVLTSAIGDGTWQYSLDGTTFTDVGAISANSALLLPGTAQFRYIPDNQHAETATISYHAWDTSSGSPGDRVDVSQSSETGGSTAFSTASDTASLTVTQARYTKVTGISPAFGASAGGTQVVITGVDFTGATAVKFGSTAATSYTVNSDTQITAASPAGTGLVDVTVTTASGTSTTAAADQFSYGPLVTGVSPAYAAPAGGAQVTITGSNFTGATAVKFGNTAATSFTFVSDTKITATAPAGTGLVNVTVTNPGGTSATSAADQFNYGPAVSGISPLRGAPAGGTQVTITGTNFTAATAVKFGTTAATSFTVVSDTQITAKAPAGTGAVDVTVTTTGGTSATSAADQFSYAPLITAVTAAQGPLAGGTQVTITGSGFTGASGVKFGSLAASFDVVSDTQITANSPAGSGAVDVTVTTAGGTSATSAADTFTYLAAPTIAGFDSSSAPAAGGMQVTITGTGFTGATAVTFGTTAATAFTVVSDTQITATVPAGANGTADVTVVATGGTSTVVPQDQFTYYMPGCTGLGLYDPTASVFYPRNSNTAGFANNFIVYGTPNGYIPIVGDWNGDGTQTIGLYDRATGLFYLSNSNASQMADTVFVFGPANNHDVPIVGNWTGNSSGAETVGLYDPTTSTFYLRNSNSSGLADVTFSYGAANGGLVPLAGDWYGGTKDTIGLYNPKTSTFYLRNSNSTGTADVTFTYGPANGGWTPVVGDWNGDGKDSIGLYSPTDSLFYLKNSNEGGMADTVIVYGAPNKSWTPIVGKWMGNAQAETAAQQVVAAPDLTPLAQAQLAPIVNEAIAQWTDAGLSTAEVQKLRQTQFVVTDLPGGSVGETIGNVVYLDASAAGNGWFVDPTPAQSEEFSAMAGSHQQLKAVDPRAVDHIDLLTVVEHELGHVLGLKDLSATADDIMDGVLGVGTRRTVSSVDAALAQ
jgi:cyclophilin family peptidyl-prolyl cis-trans isomerase